MAKLTKANADWVRRHLAKQARTIKYNGVSYTIYKGHGSIQIVIEGRREIELPAEATDQMIKAALAGYYRCLRDRR